MKKKNQGTRSQYPKFRRIFRMFFLRELGVPDSMTSRSFKISRERVDQILSSFKKNYPLGEKLLSEFIEAAPKKFWEDTKNNITLQSLIKKL